MSTIVYGTHTKQCAVHIEQQALRRDLMHGGLIAVKEVNKWTRRTAFFEVGREVKVALFTLGHYRAALVR
jgi:hypothetical protein